MKRREAALDRIQFRRAIVCGRAVMLGVDAVPDVAYARTVEHGDPGVTMPPGAVLLEVWGGKARDVAATARKHTPEGVAVLLVHHDAPGRLQRLAAWWRVVTYHYRRLRWTLRRR